LSLKVRKSGDPTVPARGISSGYDREGTTDVHWCTCPLFVSRESYRTTKVDALPRALARQGKETVHLFGNRRDLVGRQGRRPLALVMGVDLTAVVVRGSVKSGNDNGWLQVNNKILKWFG
jgi:hypothetical protein